MALPAGTKIGLYEIRGPLGAGGMGEVYQARDARLGRDVAIKLLPARLSADAVARERLRREALAAAALDHPFICRVFEIDEALVSDDGRETSVLYIVMEFVRGATLQARLASGPIPIEEAVGIAAEIAEALGEAHARQIVHRDLKPGNVILSAQGHVKVMDFGLAKDLSIDGSRETMAAGTASRGPLTGAGERVGTLAYMSPEQIVGDMVDARADIFSLGVMLCEMVTGTHPFLRPSMAATVSAILQEPPVLVPPAGFGLPATLRQILQRAMAKELAQRYQSMADLRADLLALTPSGTTTLAAAGLVSPDRVTQARRWPMVGREGELSDLLARLDEVQAGRGGMVMIGGEPGIGKTRLVEAAIAEAVGRGFLCLVGHSYEMEGAPPYVPFVEMFEYAARAVPGAAFRHALGDHAPEVARIVPELRRTFPDMPPPLEVPPEQQRWLLFNACRDVVARTSEMSPLVLVFEDLHWADEPSLQLLVHMAPVVATHAILAIGTYRDVELDVRRPFANVLEALVRERRASKLTLRRLHESGVTGMLAAMSGQPAPDSLASLVFRETEGNPFFVEEVFQHLRECGDAFDATGGWRRDLRVDTLDVPESVRLVIGRRLERLGDTARRVLTTAAVIGRSFDVALVEALEPELGDAVLDAVEEAERAHLVAPGRGQREARYLFAHELVRQTLAEALSLPRRQRLHLRIADGIERLARHPDAVPVAALAHHLYQAGAAADRDKTTRFLVAAAQEATAAAAHEDALRHVGAALSLWEGEGGPVVADLFERQGRTLRSLGRPHEAVYALHRAVDLWDATTQPDRLAATTGDLLAGYAWLGEAQPGLDLTTAVLARLAAAPPEIRFSIVQLRAVLFGLSGRIEEALAEYAAATALRTESQSAELDMVALAGEPHFRWIVSDLDRAATTSRAAARAFEAAGQLWAAVDVRWVAPFSDYYRGRLSAPADVDAMAAEAGRVGHAGARSTLLQLRTSIALSAGDLDAAERFAHESAELSRASNNRWGYFSMLLEGVITVERGRVEEGLARLDEALEWEPEMYFVKFGYWTRFLAAAQVDPARAEALFSEARPALPRADAPSPLGTWGNLGHVVLGLGLLGRREDVAALEPLTEALVRSGIVVPTWTSLAPTIAGVAAGCAGRMDAAAAHFESAIALADRIPFRHAQPDARWWYADLLLSRSAAGDRERARALLTEAATIAGSIGMVLTERRARARLETLG